MSVVKVCGGNLACRPPAFSKNAKHAFYACGAVVRVVATETGEQLHQLVGHTDDVTGVQLHPTNAKCVVTCSLDGTLRTWDADDGVLLSTHDVGQPVQYMVLATGERNRAYLVMMARDKSGEGTWSPLYRPGEEVAAALRHDRQRPSTRLVRYNLKRRLIERVVFKDNGYCTGLSCRRIGDGAGVQGGALAAVLAGGAAPGSGKGEGDMTGSYVAMTIKRKVVVWDSARQTVSAYTHTKPLTAVALHPLSNLVVTGDAEGMLIMWHEILGADAPSQQGGAGGSADGASGARKAADAPASSTLDTVVTSVQHWHAHPVTCMAFTADATLLLTGGAEAVLVLWQLATGSRTFLPRLGAPLRAIGCANDASVFSVGMSDSSSVLVDAAGLKKRWRMRGVALGGLSHSNRTLRGGLLFDPRTSSLIMNGAPGRAALQFYDPAGDRHTMELLTIDRHYVSSTDSLKKSLPPSTVVLAALCDGGRTLATVDRTTRVTGTQTGRRGADADAVADTWSLKFWEYSDSDGGFVLTALADAPHTSEVTGLEFAHHGRTAVTCSTDGTFKLWARSKRATVATITAKHRRARARGGGTTWVCRSVGSFRGGMPATAVSFSGDSSLLAVAFGHTVTLWQPATNTLTRTLAHPRPEQHIRHMSFVGASQFLVSATRSELLVWNLVTCSVWWSYRASITALAVDHSSPVFAPRFCAAMYAQRPKGDVGAAPQRVPSSGGNLVAVFDASQATPTAVYDLGAARTTAVVFAPATAAAAAAAAADDEGDMDMADDATASPHVLYCLSQTNDVLGLVPAELASRIGAAHSGGRAAAGKMAAVAAAERHMATFEAVFGTRRKRASAAVDALAAARTASAVAAERGTAHRMGSKVAPVFSGPSHLLPSMPELFDACMGAMLPAAKPRTAPQPKTQATAGAGSGAGAGAGAGAAATSWGGAAGTVQADVDMDGSSDDSGSDTDSDSDDAVAQAAVVDVNMAGAAVSVRAPTCSREASGLPAVDVRAQLGALPSGEVTDTLAATVAVVPPGGAGVDTAHAGALASEVAWLFDDAAGTDLASAARAEAQALAEAGPGNNEAGASTTPGGGHRKRARLSSNGSASTGRRRKRTGSKTTPVAKPVANGGAGDGSPPSGGGSGQKAAGGKADRKTPGRRRKAGSKTPQAGGKASRQGSRGAQVPGTAPARRRTVRRTRRS